MTVRQVEIERLSMTSSKPFEVAVAALVFVPRGTVHTFRNVGTEPGVLLVGVTPGGFVKMFEERQGVDTETNRALMKKHSMKSWDRRSRDRSCAIIALQRVPG